MTDEQQPVQKQPTTFFEWPVAKQGAPLVHYEVEPIRVPETGMVGTILGVFTISGACFCSMPNNIARQLAKMLTASASMDGGPALITPPDAGKLIVPGA